MRPEEIRQKILQALPGAHVEVRGADDHYEVRVRAAAFVGRSRLEQHRMVYAALGEAMAGPIHALAIKTEVVS